MTLHILLVDDHPAIRAGIRGALEKAEGIVVVGEAADGEEALRLIEEKRPDVVLLDCQLPGLEGIEVMAKMQARGLPTRVLALSAYKDDRYVYGMLQAGAAGYLLKEETPETVVAAVRAVARGEEWYSQQLMGQIATWARGEKPLLPATRLTGREQEVLQLLARGWDNRKIAKSLHIREGTVKNHVTNIYAKLHLHSRAEVVTWAWRQGIMQERK